MNLEKTISNINQEIIGAFAELDAWCDHDVGIIPTEVDRTPARTLESLLITNHELLTKLEEGCRVALSIAGHGRSIEFPEGYEFNKREASEIAEVMYGKILQPTEGKGMIELRRILRDQLFRSLCVLDCLRNGEGIVHTMSMSVNNSSKLDLYQCLYLMTLHIRRQLVQLEKLAVMN